jgi:hypothetical protein
MNNKSVNYSCVIWTMCVANMEFQRVNPTTQVALFALCGGNCTTIQSIAWNVYQGSSSSSSNLTIWTLFNQTAYQNIWFFGENIFSYRRKFLLNYFRSKYNKFYINKSIIFI